MKDEKELNDAEVASRVSDAYHRVSPMLVREILQGLKAAGFKVVRRVDDAE